MTTDTSQDAQAFLRKIDEAIETHSQWTRRVLRCAVLHRAPDADALRPDAHQQCAFGHWLAASPDDFEALAPGTATRLAEAHQALHAAIRVLCTQAEAGKPAGDGDLLAFESSQAAMQGLLAGARTRALAMTGHHDPLTRLLTREGLIEDFERARADAARRRENLFLVLVEIDRFDSIAEAHGPVVCDLAIDSFASALRQVVRRNEPVYRFGAEEFLILLRCENRDCADTALRRFIDAIRLSELKLAQGLTLRLTGTLGACQVDAGDDMARAITRADQALYEGKQSGHDRYVIAAAPDAAPDAHAPTRPRAAHC